MDSWVLVPCQRERIGLLKGLLSSLQHPADRVVVITTLPNPILHHEVRQYADHLVLAKDRKNIAHWWNTGLIYINIRAQRQHEVLVVSSDCVGEPYTIAMLGSFMRRENLTMVGPNPWSSETKKFYINDVRSPCDRVPGCCWMLAGESGLRCDEQFRWWYSDDDIEMQARKKSGTGILPGTGLIGAADTPLSEEKAIWAQEDRAKFVAKWGMEPW